MNQIKLAISYLGGQVKLAISGYFDILCAVLIHLGLILVGLFVVIPFLFLIITVNCWRVFLFKLYLKKLLKKIKKYSKNY